jgi:hypothetical protein
MAFADEETMPLPGWMKLAMIYCHSRQVNFDLPHTRRHHEQDIPSHILLLIVIVDYLLYRQSSIMIEFVEYAQGDMRDLFQKVVVLRNVTPEDGILNTG